MCPSIAAIVNSISTALDEFDAIYKQTEVALDSFYDANGVPTYTKSRVFFDDRWQESGAAAATFVILFKESGVAVESSFAIHVDLRGKGNDFVYVVDNEDIRYEFESGEEHEVMNAINNLALAHFECV